MKTFRRILTAFVAAAMVAASALLVSAASVSFTDTAGHWAWINGSIPYLVEKEVVNGYPHADGTYTFNPDGTVTRAEFLKMLNETFGLTATTAINYNDVSVTDWFYPVFQKAAAQGYILNYGNTATPNGALSREEATSLLVRYLDLPDDQIASASKFSDYDSIGEYFRRDVLKAIEANLINGYPESNGTSTFRPKGTLTRAEALTILYRAAGAIYNANAYSRDANANDTNAVITKGDVTLSNMNLNGRVIVGEGAASGTVTFSGNTISDTVYLRGTANVVFVNTKAKNVVVNSKGNVNISLLDGSTIENLIINQRAAVSLASGTTVNTLTVNPTANLTSFTGGGTIQNALINATNFTSTMVPLEFNIAAGLTASFSMTNYEGSSENQSAFTNTPFVTVEDAMYCVNVLPVSDGTIRYYYTNSSYCPTISTFDSYYTTSAYKSTFTVQANQSITQPTYSAELVKNYAYVVLQLQVGSRYFPPVIIENTDTSGTGFTEDPALSNESTVSFRAQASGTVYYFYTDSGAKLNANDFLVMYNAQSNELKGSVSASSIRSGAISVNSRYTEVNPYMAVMLQTATGLYYTPVIVSLGDDGFSEEPYVSTAGTIQFKTNVSGTLYYYYARTNDLPSPDRFNAEYRAADYKESLTITLSRAGTISYQTRYASSYPYIILCIRNGSGNYLQPVAVSIDFDPGFTVLPEVIDSNVVRFRTSTNGTVYYYYTKTEAAPSIQEFNTEYQAAGSRYSGTVSASSTNYGRITYESSKASSYSYMAIMFVDNENKSYQPVVVNLKATADTGFTTAPYVDERNERIYFRTEQDCEVYWFYSRTEDTVSASEFYDEWYDARWGDNIRANAGELDYFDYRDDLLDTYPYIIISTTENERSSDFTYPVILNVRNPSTETTSGSGIRVTGVDKDAVYVVALEDGRLYYYETNSSRTPTTNGYYDEYREARDGNWREVYSGREYEIPCSGRYDYMMLQLDGTDSRGNDKLYNVVSVDLTETWWNGNGSSTRGENGFTLSNFPIDPNNRTITLTPRYSGSITVSVTDRNGNQVPIVNGGPYTYLVTANEETDIPYPLILPVSSQIYGEDLYIALQLTDSRGDTYDPFFLSVDELMLY